MPATATATATVPVPVTVTVTVPVPVPATVTVTVTATVTVTVTVTVIHQHVYLHPARMPAVTALPGLTNPAQGPPRWARCILHSAHVTLRPGVPWGVPSLDAIADSCTPLSYAR